MPDTTVECPVCGCDVRGCTETVLDDGRRRWMQRTQRVDKDRIEGGLVHVEGGRRCLSDAKDRQPILAAITTGRST